MYFIKLIIILVILNFQIVLSEEKIKIKYKVGEEIITNVDILDEKNYLIFLRPNLKNISEDELLKISENSLIRNVIKKKEIESVFKDLNSINFTEEIKKNLFNYKNVKTEEEFLKLLNKNNIEYEQVVKRLKYEGLWNELIFRKFNSLVKIDEKTLKKELELKISNNKKYQYNLSEILFEISQNENAENKYKKIMKSINSNDFKSAATKFSISNSSSKGGEIGWIKETMLSENLNQILKNMKIKQISKPIKYPNGYLLLKINDKKEMKQIISVERELNELLKFERNKQLNQFSLLFYKKLKKNTVINEY